MVSGHKKEFGGGKCSTVQWQWKKFLLEASLWGKLFPVLPVWLPRHIQSSWLQLSLCVLLIFASMATHISHTISFQTMEIKHLMFQMLR